MASTRINGIRMNLQTLTAHELDAVESMTKQRVASAAQDLVKILAERLRRRKQELTLF